MQHPTPEPTPLKPERSFYSRNQLLWFGLLLNHFVSVWMLAANYRRMGQGEYQRHALGIGGLWMVASLLVVLTVAQRTDVRTAQYVWLLLNLASLLAVLYLQDAQQGPWIVAELEAGRQAMANLSALIYAGLIVLILLVAISLLLTVLVALGMPMPQPPNPDGI